MNVLWHELRARWKSTAIWIASLFLLMVVSMAKFEAITAQGGAAMKDMMKSFPSTIQAVFGMSGLDLTTVAGYFGVCFLIMAITLAVHAGLTGAGVLADEEVERTTEFLYTKPRGRVGIILAKLIAGWLLLAIVWVGAAAGSIVGIKKYAHFGDFTPDFWRLMVATAVIQLVFFAIGTISAAVSRNARAYGRIVSIAIFGSYLLYVFAKLSPHFNWLHYVSIFSWFDAADILSAHTIKVHYLIASSIIVIALTCLTFAYYRRRDLRV